MKHRAYTLIELLVVLAIIAALTALIFGAMGPARERARRVGCASNMHQWGLAFAMYSEDYGGRIPNVGDHMSGAQMGLPPVSYLFQFDKAYKLDGTAAMNCPDTHYPLGTRPRASSYIMAGFDTGEQEISDTAFIRGPQYPLLVCEMHNANTDFMNQPTWAKKNVQVLRINQQIQYENISVRKGTREE